MDSTFKPMHLLLNELDYELRIRNVVSKRSQDEKRKILARLLEKERYACSSLLLILNKMT